MIVNVRKFGCCMIAIVSKKFPKSDNNPILIMCVSMLITDVLLFRKVTGT